MLPGEDDLEARFSGPNAVQFLKSLPGKPNLNVVPLSGPMEDVVVALLDALIIKISYDDENSQGSPSTTNSGESSIPNATVNGVFDMPARHAPESMPHISRNSSANDLLQQDDDDIVSKVL